MGKKCGLPSATLGPCDMEWGHNGAMHASVGDGFFVNDRANAEHARRQAARRHPHSAALPITTLTHSKIETGPLEREIEHVGGDWSPAQHTRRAS